MPFFWLVSLDIVVVTGIGLKNGIQLKKEKLTDIGFLLVFPGLGNGLFDGYWIF